MNAVYHNHIRKEIEPLLPLSATRIVDVGCGSGRTTAWIKSLFPSATTVGFEGNPALKSELECNVDEAHIIDLNIDIPSAGAADVVLYLDVLEHIYKPESLLRGMLQHIKPDARIIVSLPNIAHYSVSLPLLLFGKFQYGDAGILDRTHVRFYVRESAVQLLNSAGLRVVRGLEAGFKGRRSWLLDKLSLGLFRSRLAQQYILLAVPMQQGETQTPFAWGAAY